MFLRPMQPSRAPNTNYWENRTLTINNSTHVCSVQNDVTRSFYPIRRFHNRGRSSEMLFKRRNRGP